MGIILFMAQNFLIAIYIILGFLGFLIVFLAWQVLKLKKRLDIFLRGKNQGLEKTIKDLLEKSEESEQAVQKILERVSRLEKISQISLQKIGVVRYNPFKEVGGDQSFSIALLDKRNSGFVITSLYTREENKVFAKPIIKGKSEYSLSEEERKAIEQARAG